MSDLPPIRNGGQKPVMEYDGLPESHFQRKMRKNATSDLTDHMCKQVAQPFLSLCTNFLPFLPIILHFNDAKY
jgi:hypothetical protein